MKKILFKQFLKIIILLNIKKSYLKIYIKNFFGKNNFILI